MASVLREITDEQLRDKDDASDEPISVNVRLTSGNGDVGGAISETSDNGGDEVVGAIGFGVDGEENQESSSFAGSGLLF